MSWKFMIPEEDRKAYFQAAIEHGVSEDDAREYLGERARRDRHERAGFSAFYTPPVRTSIGEGLVGLFKLLNPTLVLDRELLSELYQYHILHKTQPSQSEEISGTDKVTFFLDSLKKEFPELTTYLERKERDEEGLIVWDEKLQDLGYIVDHVIPDKPKRFEHFSQFFVRKDGSYMTGGAIGPGADKVRAGDRQASAHITALFP